MYYEVKREVTILVEANTRDDAIKNAKSWDGQFWSVCSSSGVIQWNGKSRLLSAKKHKGKPERP